jgi:acyl-CoA thioesterase FadM
MNNGRYLSVMDFGRIDWAARSGVLRTWLARRWRPLVGAATIRYRRPLHPLQRYTLHTRLLCWDDKWMYFEQRFERDGDVYAIAFIKGLVRGRRENVRPAEMLAALGVFSPSPLMPAAITAWNESERLTRGEALSSAPARPETRMPN